MSKHNNVSTVEHAKGGKSGGGFKRHCARKWWIYVIAFIVIALAVVLGVIFGAVPKLAQKSINNSKLRVDGVSILEPKEDSFLYSQNATVNGHVPVKAHMNDQRIGMFLPEGEETIFMYLNVTRLDLLDEFYINVADYPMEIVDKEAFGAFTRKALSEKEITLGLRSRPEIVSGSLHNYVDYNKRVTLKGFDKLHGIYLQNSKVLDEPEEDGTNMIAELFIPNPSSFTLEVGNLTCNFASDILGPLGIGRVNNLVIRRGDNVANVRAVLIPEMYENPLVNATTVSGGVNLTVTGNSSVYNGVHISWLEGPLTELPLEVPIKGSASKD